MKNKNAIVGYSGFVGNNLLSCYKFDYFYNSENFNEAKNKSFYTLFFTGIPSVKWYANKYPKKDYLNIEKIKKILSTIQVKKIILISTIDVYENTSLCLDENYRIKKEKNHTYGKNRYEFELFIKKKFKNKYHIIRLPALFGKGLKKNIIYDLINNNEIEKININSSFQWYCLDWLKKDIDIILKNKIKLCNLFTEPLETKELIKIICKDKNINFKNEKRFEYNLKTKYAPFFNSNDYIRSNKEVKKNLRKFLEFKNIDKSKLSVSNICVNEISQFQFSYILKLYGFKRVQIAPTKLIKGWDNLENINLDIFEKNEIIVNSLQSITYGLDSLNIFDYKTNNLLHAHLLKIIDFSNKKKIDFLVFGCPKNRKIINQNLNNEKKFIEFFRKIGNYSKKRNIKISIENISKKYNCNYLNNINSCLDINKKINKKNIKNMIDIGNAILERDESNLINSEIYNIDVSTKNMKPLLKITKNYKRYVEKIINLKVKNYNLEMLNNTEKELQNLNISLNNFILLFKD